MGAFPALLLGRRPVRCRCLVVYRVDPRAVERLLPEKLRVRSMLGRAIVTACYTRLGTPALFARQSLFRRREGAGAGSDHLAYRFAVEREDGSAATWIARRETSSWLEARCGAKLLGGEYGRSAFQVKEDAFGIELAVGSERGETFYLRAETAPATNGSLFPSAQALEAFLGADQPVRPYDVFAPEADELDLAEHFAPTPLAVFEARAAFLSAEPFAPGAAELDSAWRIVSRRMTPVPSLRPAFRVLPDPGSSPAMPTG